MKNQYSEAIDLLSKSERDLYLTIQEDLNKLIHNERKFILANQKIVLNEYESEHCNASISRLYN